MKPEDQAAFTNWEKDFGSGSKANDFKAWEAGLIHRDAQSAVAVNEPVGVIKRYGYQALFNAIAETTKIQGGCIGVSVLDFAKSLDAAIAAAEAQNKEQTK